MTLLLGVVLSLYPGQAAVAPARSTPPDYMIVVWYDRARPLDTFRYEVYDVRKSEFTPAVRRWLADVHVRYPQYDAFARPHVVSRATGSNEKLEIGQAVTQEFLLLGASHGYDFGGLGRPLIPTSPTPVLHPLPTVGPQGRPPTVGPSPASGIPFPVPMPYPRPHP